MEFWVEFVRELEAIRRQLAEALLCAPDFETSPLREFFQRHWLDVEAGELPELERVVAVDGSGMKGSYGAGISISITRALAKDFSSGEKYKYLRVRLHRGGYEFSPFHTAAMEIAEHVAARRAVLEGDPDIVLLDGSISARLMSAVMLFFRVPSIAPEYAASLLDLMDSAADRGVALASIAKSARSRQLVSIFLSESLAKIEDEKLRKAAERAIDELEAPPTIRDVPAGGVTVGDLVALASSRLADADFVAAWLPGPGWTEPVAAAPLGRRLRGAIDDLMSGELGASAREVRAAARDAGVDLDGVLDRLSVVPGVALSYVKPFSGIGDPPLKVEAVYPAGVSWSVARWPEFIGQPPREMELAIAAATRGFAGQTMHNVWLEIVDKEVKLRVDERDIYERKLWEVVRRVIPHARGDRRWIGI